ncbi:MAG: hypothetical protein CMA63_01700 [Euryarchaeota archaeon]|nr:hypothetical protein [Euryarchaeota archaeon]
MQQILIDACGWVAIIDSKMNMDAELSRIYGPCSFLLLQSVEQELISLNNQRPRNKNLLLGLLMKKSEPIEALSQDFSHPDDQLFTLASKHGYPVLTVDIDLKRRLYEQGLPVLEVNKSQRLHLLEKV